MLNVGIQNLFRSDTGKKKNGIQCTTRYLSGRIGLNRYNSDADTIKTRAGKIRNKDILYTRYQYQYQVWYKIETTWYSRKAFFFFLLRNLTSNYSPCTLATSGGGEGSRATSPPRCQQGVFDRISGHFIFWFDNRYQVWFIATSDTMSNTSPRTRCPLPALTCQLLAVVVKVFCSTVLIVVSATDSGRQTNIRVPVNTLLPFRLWLVACFVSNSSRIKFLVRRVAESEILEKQIIFLQKAWSRELTRRRWFVPDVFFFFLKACHSSFSFLFLLSDCQTFRAHHLPRGLRPWYFTWYYDT